MTNASTNSTTTSAVAGGELQARGLGTQGDHARQGRGGAERRPPTLSVLPSSGAMAMVSPTAAGGQRRGADDPRARPGGMAERDHLPLRGAEGVGLLLLGRDGEEGRA
jgi:hypothetical protein